MTGNPLKSEKEGQVLFKVLLIMEIVLAFFSFCFGIASSMMTLNRRSVPAFWLKMAGSLCFLTIGFMNAFYSTDGVFAVGVLAGLFYGFAGDAFLAAPSVLPGRARIYQAGGVLCFAMGHVLYCAAMIGYYGISVWSFVFAAVLLAGVLFWTASANVRAGPLMLPGTIYMAFVCMMAGTALSVLITRFSVSAVLFAAGGLLFALSDTVLILNAFSPKKNLLTHYGVLMTYFPAQSLIALSLLLFAQQ